MKKLTAKQKAAIKAVDAIRDDQIDTSDIPERMDFTGGVRRRFVKAGTTTAISLRINQADLSRARAIADKKGLSYQSYLKSLIHEGLEQAAAK